MSKFCPKCGNETTERYCSECGSDTNTTTVEVSNKSSDGLAIAGFVLSCTGLICCLIPGIIGAILSAIALSKKDQSDSRGFAIAGLTLGIIETLVLIVYVFIYIFYFAAIISFLSNF